MNLLRTWVRRSLLGSTYSQEYLCLALEELQEALEVYLTVRGTDEFSQVTNRHILLGYQPLLIGVIPGPEKVLGEGLDRSEDICLSFKMGDFRPDHYRDQFSLDSGSVGFLRLKKVSTLDLGGQALFVYEGVRAHHRLLPPFFRMTNGVFQRLKKKKSSNISLPGNLYEQVRLAYCVPRTISVITLGSDSAMNMFPSDLQGPAGEQTYAVSLRHSGKACQQVETNRKLVISTVASGWCKEVYGMASNHMGDLKPTPSFPVSDHRSEVLGIPLPSRWQGYRELELVTTMDISIHRLMFFKVVNANPGKGAAGTLCHIHQYYAQWRKNNHLSTPVLIR